MLQFKPYFDVGFMPSSGSFSQSAQPYCSGSINSAIVNTVCLHDSFHIFLAEYIKDSEIISKDEIVLLLLNLNSVERSGHILRYRSHIEIVATSENKYLMEVSLTKLDPAPTYFPVQWETQGLRSSSYVLKA
ncbi:hypothetical protein VNO77_31035 [Canavalia gladiata]|uniref:Uncharacterized protein n=1 Tax=Canavalia gladiata TaxID=3824 RepID=A0AAN9KNN7_CANGL